MNFRKIDDGSAVDKFVFRDGKLFVTARSALSGEWNEAEMNVSYLQFATWKGGMVIQDAMPHLTPDEREFMLSGITPDEWNRAFPANDD